MDITVSCFANGSDPKASIRIQAKAYPERLLADWRRHFREDWMPNKAIDYFRGRDSVALQYLPKLLPKRKTA
ncbi:hypothetical protein [Mesorhizobium sp. B2-4-9]|uniref:hypothetical protein n=1 Tax=Mesorhizobium sp. B2-4-9 TaxID=2589940 RepID=UPI001FED7142|nr:hypothetical protein [Mesorhizobium sp. B2-4-9]